MRVLCWLVAMVAWLPQAGAAARFALAVGSNIGRPDESALRWAEEDARRVHALMLELGAVAAGRAILLQGATVVEVRSAFARLQGQVEEARRHGLRTELFFFYSGHGDATGLHLGQERLALDDLRALLQSVPADTRVAIIDACRSTGLARGRDKGALPGPAFDISLARETGPTGSVLVSSAGADEIAQESDELRGSFFTHHMLSGLRGAADTDRDGRVTLDEIYRYTYHHTLASSHGETAAVQHPEMEVALEGEGELVISVLERASATLGLPSGLGGDFLIVDDRNGRVFAEVRKPAKDALPLALPAGRYRVQLRSQGRIFAGEVALEWGGHKALATDDLTEQALVAALTKGSELDPRPLAIRSGALAGSPTALGDGTALGGALGAELRLAEWPLYLMVDWQLGVAEAQNEAWRYRHIETRLSAGLAYGLWLGPLRLAVGFSFGVLLVSERATRRDADRLGLIDGQPTSQDSVAIGPVIVPGLGLRVPLEGAWAIGLQAELPIAFLPIDAVWETRVGWQTVLGVEYRL